MSGKKLELNSLEARKQLLVVASELNRAQMVSELVDFKTEVNRLKQELSGMSSALSLTTKVMGGISSIGRIFSNQNEGGKFSWVSTLLGSMKTGTSLWLLLRSLRRNK